MNADEKQANQIKLKARLNMLRLELRAGKATAEQVAEAEAALEAIRGFVPAKEPKTILTTGKAAPVLEKLNGKTLSAEAQKIVSDLSKTKEEIDLKKRELSMSLQNVPQGVTCKEITQEILAHRERWKALGDSIYFVQEYGFLPEQAAAQPEADEVDLAEYGDQLPNDRFVLDKMIKNLTINVFHKWPDRMKTAKTEAKKAEYNVRISKGGVLLQVMKDKFKKIPV